jgi:choline dehydrogenase-like flavoprotein
MAEQYDVIIVGTGAGGAALAQRLGERGLKVLMLEAGTTHAGLGSFKNALQFYDANKVTQYPATTQEGILLWRTLMTGGSTVAALGNMLPSMVTELNHFGIDISEELDTFLAEIATAPLSEALLSPGAHAIMAAGERLGMPFHSMPKAIVAERCNACGHCPFGCAMEARWTANVLLEQALSSGVDVLYNTQVQQVLMDNNRAVGVRAVSGRQQIEYHAERVILSAGGIGTPIILQKSGIEEAGKQLFLDVFVTVVGETDEINQLHEPSMALVNDQFHASDGFILSPYIPVHPKVAFAEFGPVGMLRNRRRMLGLMVKTTDDLVGWVDADGKVSKTLTEDDQTRLQKGTRFAKQILIEAGAKPASLLVSKPQGAHPGGTAAIGQVVDNWLQTQVENLFVCDASVLPAAPGLPPIAAIVALARWFARRF